MAGGGYQDDDGAISGINVTPLVDVVLVLLVIFMVTAPMIAARGISVDSPNTVSGETVPSTMRVSYTAERQLYVNKDHFPADRWDDAEAAVAALRQEDPEIKALVAVDKTLSYGEAMEVLDLVKRAGITKFTLSTAPKIEQDD